MFERLTIKTDICIEPENEIVYHNPNDPEGMYNILDLAECLYSGGEAEAGILMEISRRLAAYEDSGLSPEEVQELAKAKAEGRLYILPVKVGDTVYFASHLYEKVEEYQVTEITNPIYDITVIAREHQYIAPIPLCSIADIGKTVFLTREEAEKAIGSETERGKEG